MLHERFGRPANDRQHHHLLSLYSLCRLLDPKENKIYPILWHLTLQENMEGCDCESVEHTVDLGRRGSRIGASLPASYGLGLRRSDSVLELVLHDELHRLSDWKGGGTSGAEALHRAQKNRRGTQLRAKATFNLRTRNSQTET